jgi:hypothetical protein
MIAKTARISVFAVVSGLALVFAPAPSAFAQSRFCATYDDDATPEDCSFTSLQMCQQSVSGIGGYCAPQGIAPAMAPPPLFGPPSFGPPYAFGPAPVPPPPTDAAPFNDPNFDRQSCGNPPSPPC